MATEGSGNWEVDPAEAIRHLYEVFDSLDARGHLRAAIGFQSKFNATGDYQAYVDAAHYYDRALEKAQDAPALTSIIMCYQLSLRLGEFFMGRLGQETIEEEIAEAKLAAKAVSRRTDFALRRHNLAWIKGREAEIHGQEQTTASMESVALKEEVALEFVRGLADPVQGLQYP